MQYQQDSIEAHIEQRFEKLQKIGSGAYGHVYKMREKSTSQVYAVKKLFLAFQNDVDAQRTFRQIAILKQLDHPNIVKLKEVIKAENDLDLYLVFEYVECDLFNAIKDGVLNDVHKKYIIYQLNNALYYLHSAGVLHRDLKPSNILIDSACKIKICDFGLSRTLYHYNNEKPVMTEFIATRWYRAPEVLFGSTQYSFKSDMWSLGCLIYQVFAAKPLLPGSDSVNQIEKVLEFKGFPSQKQSEQLKVDRIQVLLSHFKTSKLPESYYFKPNFNPKLLQLLKGLLQYSPQSRWGTKQVGKCELISQFENYEMLISAKTPVILRVSDNEKCEKQFYRNFIQKIFTKKTLKPFEKSLIASQHRSSSQSRRNASTSLRKNMLKKGATSLHSKIPSSKQFSKTIHCTMRNSPVSKKIKVYKSENVSPFKQKGKQNAPVRKKSENRKLYKNPSKSIIKEETVKKTLKRRAIVYNF